MQAQLVLKAGKEKSLLRKHPWVFKGAVDKIIGQAKQGGTINIVSHSGEFLAKAAYSPHSQICARVWTYSLQENIDDVFFKKRVANAIALRKEWLAQANTNAYRLVAAESDGLPGITVDKYDNIIVIQLLSAGADKHRKKIVNALLAHFPDCVIHERSDVAVREKEGLSPVVQTLQGSLPETVIIKENDIKIEVDLINGHKTGFYLDQRKNRQIAGQHCRGKRVLNCFSYTGTFALYALKGGAQEVINLDVSASALNTSKHNISLNFDENIANRAKHLKVDVFEQLRKYDESGEKFDLIVMDPPKFIENKHHLEKAARGYKDINRLACKLLKPSGKLLTFSCSGLMPASLFNKIVADSALDAETELNYVEYLYQDFDHMTASYFPEGMYLKGLVCIKR
ncbi:class I SAM-dependent rRNA methyltransferase [Agaribacter flavus]|uniref:Class I SAM-dependent rRNA methyltransferase n=1 Tax=Agaribacter flavus TaxID=1902781 RepID=A0ABV7FSZ5_9ALTE